MRSPSGICNLAAIRECLEQMFGVGGIGKLAREADARELGIAKNLLRAGPSAWCR